MKFLKILWIVTIVILVSLCFTILVTNNAYGLDDVAECQSDLTKRGDCYRDENGIHHDIVVPIYSLDINNPVTYTVQLYVDKNWNNKFTRQDRGNQEGGCGYDQHLKTEWLPSQNADLVTSVKRKLNVYNLTTETVTYLTLNRCSSAQIILNSEHEYVLSGHYQYREIKLDSKPIYDLIVSDGGSVNIPLFRHIWLPMMMTNGILFNEE